MYDDLIVKIFMIGALLLLGAVLFFGIFVSYPMATLIALIVGPLAFYGWSAWKRYPIE